ALPIYQDTQLVDGEVDRVRDRTGEILGYGSGRCQVTVCKVGQFVEQTQNRSLVTLVGFCGVHQTATGIAEQADTDECRAENRNSSKNQDELIVDRTGGGLHRNPVGDRKSTRLNSS